MKPLIKKTMSLFVVFILLSTNFSFAGYIDPDYEIKDLNNKKSKFLKQLTDSGYKDSIEEYFKKIETKGTKKTKDGSVDYYVQYLLGSGKYMENVRSGVYVSGLAYADKTVKKGNSVCYHSNEPQNLLNHNCDVPSLGTELYQNIINEFDTQGIQNANRTTSVAKFGFGLPKGIEDVPIDPNLRTQKYTALELYGYDLHYTNYYGEYDHILTSSEARMLANIGFFGKSKLLGASIWNGVTGALADLWNNWVFSPTKWGKKSNGFASGVISTVVDSSDLNVISQNSWKRPTFTNTLYNAHYISDKDVIEKGRQDFLQYFLDNLFKEAYKHPRIKEVFYLMKDGDGWPHFVYDPNVCLETSCDEDGNCECVRYETEEEQFARWKKEPYQVQYNKRAIKQDIKCFDGSETYKALRSCWDVPWLRYARKEANHDLPVMQQIMSKLENDFFENNPHYDVNSGISHYVCADEEGVPIGDSLTSYQYVYDKHNSRTQEFRNTSCSPVRPSIKGSLQGNGEGKSTDTRYLLYLDSKSGEAFNTPSGSLNFFGELGKTISVFFAKLTNTLLSASFSNILSFLKIDTMLTSVLETFRDSIFLPASVLAAAISAFYIFVTSFKSSGQAMKSLVGLFVIFMIGASLLYKPQIIVNTLEVVPNKVDNFIAETIIDNDVSNDLCSATGEDSGIRNIQCVIWQLSVFEPWVRGQWGIGYDQLDDDDFNNRNEELVGNGSVVMGGGHTENNWALYQLDKTKVGTITTEDTGKLEGTTSRAMYKIVDLQAGPNSGYLSDGKYLKQWSGLDNENRNAIQILSAIVSITLFFAVGMLSILKIQLTLLFALQLFVFPIMFAVGMLPKGDFKLKEYLLGLFGIFVKRVFIVIALSIVLVMLRSLTNLSTSYLYTSLFIVLLLLAFILYFNELMEKVLPTFPTNSGLGGMKSKINANNLLPRSLAMEWNMKKNAMWQSVTGLFGGAVAGAYQERKNRQAGIKSNESAVVSGARRAMRSGYNRGNMMGFNRQRRLGFGLLTNLSQAEEAAKASVSNNFIIEDSEMRSDVSTIVSNIEQKISFTQETIKNIEEEIIRNEQEGGSDNAVILETLKDDLSKQRSELDKYTTVKYRLNTITKDSSVDEDWKMDSNAKINKALSFVKLKKVNMNINGELEISSVEKQTENLVNNIFEIIEEENNVFSSKEIARKEIKKNVSAVATPIIENIKNKVDNVNNMTTTIKESVQKEEKTDYQKDMEAYYDQFNKYKDFMKGDISSKSIDNLVENNIEISSKQQYAVREEIKELLEEYGAYPMKDRTTMFSEKEKKNNKLTLDTEYGTETENMIESFMQTIGRTENLKVQKPNREDYDSRGNRKVVENNSKQQKVNKNVIKEKVELPPINPVKSSETKKEPIKEKITEENSSTVTTKENSQPKKESSIEKHRENIVNNEKPKKEVAKKSKEQIVNNIERLQKERDDKKLRKSKIMEELEDDNFIFENFVNKRNKEISESIDDLINKKDKFREENKDVIDEKRDEINKKKRR